MKTIVTNQFVLSCTTEQLCVLALFVGMSAKKIEHAIKRNTLRVQVGTRLANSAEHGAAFAAGTLEVELPAAEQPSGAQQSARKQVKSAKAWLRELLSVADAEYTLAELVALSGKTEVNIRTMLSDLRSVKYAGKSGVFLTKAVRKNGKVYYSAQ